MRPCDSGYDRHAATGSTKLLAALRLAHTVETYTTGSVDVDGQEIDRDAWDRMVMAWDGSADSLEDLGWERAAEALRDALDEQIQDLRTEAGKAGDEAQVAICDRALDGDRDALLECARALADAAAMAD